MRPQLTLIRAGLLLALPLYLPASTDQVAYTGLKSFDGFVFPLPEEKITAMPEQDLRRRAWLMLQAITRPVTGKGGTVPLFETWYSRDEVMSPAPLPGIRNRFVKFSIPGEWRVDLQLKVPLVQAQASLRRDSQSEASGVGELAQRLIGLFLKTSDVSRLRGLAVHLRPEIAQTLGLPVSDWKKKLEYEPARESPGLSRVYFNREAAAFIKSNQLYDISKLKELAQSPRAGTDPIQFGSSAVALKTLWYIVDPTDETTWSVPTWTKEQESIMASQPVDLWTFNTKIEPRVATSAKPCSALCISDFHYIELSKNDVESLKKIDPKGIFFANPFIEARAGAYAILLALHVTTRETKTWVWSTYWWTPQVSAPADIISKGPWNHYNGAITLTGTSAQKPNPVYNPYLEGKLKRGARSNCLTCHLKSAWMGEIPEVEEFETDLNAPYFKGKLKLDFLWTIYTNAVEQVH